MKRNAVANLAGHASPLLVALFALPVLTRGLGTDRFGVLTLAWAILGYFSLFDLGLGRAVTKLAAEKIGLRDEESLPRLVWTSLILMSALGLLGTFFALAISPWLVHDVLRIPPILQAESLQSFYLLAVSIPLVTGTAGLRGLLEATQRVDLINLVRIPLGAFTFLGPLAVLPFSRSLVPVVGVLLVSRVLAWIAHLLLCFRVVPKLRSLPVLDLLAVPPLLRFGGWMSISNIIGPLMVILDRFVIGAMISVSAVAYYTAPYEVITKLWMIPAALTGVLFPAFASAWVQDKGRASRLFTEGVKYTFLLLFPLTLLIVTFSHDGLAVWLGPDYAENSTRALQWLAIGVFVNCFAQIPFALIQAAGRPDITAKFHLVELPFYLVALWLLIGRFGIEGAAMAWTIRCAADTALLFFSVRRFLPAAFLPASRLAWIGSAALSSVAAGALPMTSVTKAVFLGTIMTLYVIVGWHRVLAPEDRRRIRGRLAKGISLVERGARLR